MSYNPFTLEGKTILVTGASSGIGRATAIECSKMGARVIITGRNEERLEETYRNLQKADHKFIVSDLGEENGIQNLVSQLPAIDGVVHCAGITSNLPFQFATREKFDSIMDVNFYAPVEISRLSIKAKKLNKNSSIVFISSISGVFTSSVALSIYSASKGAINGLIKGLALDLASKGIRVNSVNPGIVETNIFDSGVITTEQLAVERNKYPLKRYGKPEEIAHAVIYLLSDASSWVTGSNIVIDGGYTLQ